MCAMEEMRRKEREKVESPSNREKKTNGRSMIQCSS